MACRMVCRVLNFDVDSSEWRPAEWLAVFAAVADLRGWWDAHVVYRRARGDGVTYVTIQCTAWVPEVKGSKAHSVGRSLLRREAERRTRNNRMLQTEVQRTDMIYPDIMTWWAHNELN